MFFLTYLFIHCEAKWKMTFLDSLTENVHVIMENKKRMDVEGVGKKLSVTPTALLYFTFRLTCTGPSCPRSVSAKVEGISYVHWFSRFGIVFYSLPALSYESSFTVLQNLLLSNIYKLTTK